jgi:cation diffusion facilitator family transporter
MPSSVRAWETARAAKLSVLSNSVLTLAKLGAGFASGSISVISEAAHSANDLVASLLAFYSIRKANEPADERHGYGHGKYESLSGAAEALLIVVAALVIAYHAGVKLWRHDFDSQEQTLSMVVMGVSAAANMFVSQYLFRTAKKHDSIALQADAWHLRTDVVTSAGVFVGLGVIALTDWHPLDPIVALFVAALILVQGYRLITEALGQLLDSSLPPEELEIVKRLVADHQGRHVGFHALRSRRAGRQRHLDLHLVVCSEMHVNEAHGLCDTLEQRIADQLPGTDVVIHVEPCNNLECLQLRAGGQWVLCFEEEREKAQATAADEGSLGG